MIFYCGDASILLQLGRLHGSLGKEVGRRFVSETGKQDTNSGFNVGE